MLAALTRVERASLDGSGYDRWRRTRLAALGRGLAQPRK